MGIFRWVFSRLVWLLVQLLPERLAIWLLDTLWPSWADRAAKVMRSQSL